MITHALLNKKVDVIEYTTRQIIATGVLTRVVDSRFGLLATLDGNMKHAWDINCVREHVPADTPEKRILYLLKSASFRNWLANTFDDHLLGVYGANTEAEILEQIHDMFIKGEQNAPCPQVSH